MNIDGMGSLHPTGPGELPTPKQAHEAAGQFEAMFLKQIVRSMRESASSLTGGSLLGDGVGSDVREDWFDSMMAGHVSSTGRVGLADVLYADWKRAGKVGPEPDAAADPAADDEVPPAGAGADAEAVR